MKRKVGPIKRARKKLEIWLARLGCVLLTPLPRSFILRMAKFSGAVGYRFSRKLRDIGMANLDLVYGDQLTSEDKARILKRSFQTMALVTLDIIWFSKDTATRIPKYVSIDQGIRAVFSEDKAYICLTGHLGNWEVLGHFAAVNGYPMASVATPLKNPAVERIFREARLKSGQAIIEKKGAVRAMLRGLKNKGRVALLIDQNTMLNDGGIFVDVFGVPATVSAAAATLSLRTGTDIWFGFGIPQGNGTYKIHVPSPIPARPYDKSNLEEAIRRLTVEITEVYEEAILRYPECWLWMYKRWKHIRPGEKPDRYPFYAMDLADFLIPPSYKRETHDN